MANSRVLYLRRENSWINNVTNVFNWACFPLVLSLDYNWQYIKCRWLDSNHGSLVSEATAQPIVLLPPWPNCCTLVLSVEEKGETWQVEAAVFRLEAGRHRLASPLLRSPKEDETERPNRSQLGFSLSGKIGLGNGWVVEWSKLCFRDLLNFLLFTYVDETTLWFF